MVESRLFSSLMLVEAHITDISQTIKVLNGKDELLTSVFPSARTGIQLPKDTMLVF